MNDPKVQNPLPTTIQVSDLRRVLLEWDGRLQTLDREIAISKKCGAILAAQVAELSVLAIQSCRADIAALLPPQELS